MAIWQDIIDKRTKGEVGANASTSSNIKRWSDIANEHVTKKAAETLANNPTINTKPTTVAPTVTVPTVTQTSNRPAENTTASPAAFSADTFSPKVNPGYEPSSNLMDIAKSIVNSDSLKKKAINAALTGLESVGGVAGAYAMQNTNKKIADYLTNSKLPQNEAPKLDYSNLSKNSNAIYNSLKGTSSNTSSNLDRMYKDFSNGLESYNSASDIANAKQSGQLLNNYGKVITDSRLINELDGAKLHSAIINGIVDPQTLSPEQYQSWTNYYNNRANNLLDSVSKKTSFNDLVNERKFTPEINNPGETKLNKFIDERNSSFTNGVKTGNLNNYMDLTKDSRSPEAYEKIENPIARNVARFGGGFVTSFSDDLTRDINSVATPIKNANGYYGNAIPQMSEWDKTNDGSVAYNLGSTIGQVSSQIAKAWITKGATANEKFVAISTALDDASRTAIEKEKEYGESYGTGYGKAIPKSIANGIIESYLDAVAKGFRRVANIKVSQTETNWIKDLLTDAIGEGKEEVLQGLVDALYNFAAYGDYEDFKDDNGNFSFMKMIAVIGKEGLYGFAGGLFGGGVSKVRYDNYIKSDEYKHAKARYDSWLSNVGDIATEKMQFDPKVQTMNVQNLNPILNNANNISNILPGTNANFEKIQEDYISNKKEQSIVPRSEKIGTFEKNDLVKSNISNYLRATDNLISNDGKTRLKDIQTVGEANAKNEGEIKEFRSNLLNFELESLRNSSDENTNLGENGSFAFLNSYDDKNNTKNVADYETAFQQFYQSGKLGIPFGRVLETASFAHNFISADTMEAAYKAGTDDRKVILQNAYAQYNYESQLNEAKNSKTGGIIKNEFSSAFRNENKFLYNVIDNLSRGTGVKVLISDKTKGNGNFHDKIVEININSKDGIGKTFFHELTHNIAKDNEAFKSYKSTFIDYLVNSKQYDTTFANYDEKYHDLAVKYLEKHNLEVNDENIKDYVDEEIVADLAGNYLTDEKYVRSLVKKDRRGSGKIKNAIRDLAANVKSIVDSVKKSSVSYEKYGSQIEVTYETLKKAEKLFADLIKEYDSNIENSLDNTNIRFSMNEIDGIEYFEAENIDYLKPDGSKMTSKEIFDSLDGKEILTNDNKTIYILRNIPNKNLYSELFKRYPKYFDNVENIKKLNSLTNENIVNLIQNSDFDKYEIDYQDKHKINSIVKFETRIVNFFDGEKAYEIKLSIAVLSDNKLVAYAKQYIGYNENLTKKIKSYQATGNQSRLNDITLSNSIVPQTEQKVNKIEKDSEGRELSPGIQEYFKNVSKEALDSKGRLKVFYHGTPIGGFTVFNTNSYFTDIKDYANTYQNPIASSNSVPAKYNNQNPMSYEVYLNIQKPFNISNANEMKIYKEEYIKGGYAQGIDPYIEHNDIDKIDWTEGDNLVEFLEENYPGVYDSIIINEGGNEDGTRRGMSIAVLKSNIIKNVDNLNPTDSEDIRFSIDETVRELIPDEIQNLIRDEVLERDKYESKEKITETIDELNEKISKETESTPFEEKFNNRRKVEALQKGFDNLYDYFVDRDINKEIEYYKRDSRKYDNLLENNKKEIAKKEQLNQEIANATPFKRNQFNVIQNTNPMFDDYHVGIRSPKDILTWREVLKNERENSFVWGDFSEEEAERALKRGKITVYSSYPIRKGVFVSTSRVQAEQYAGGEGSRVYSKEIPLEYVAWINGDEGQYTGLVPKTKDIAKQEVEETRFSLDSEGREISPELTERLKDSKARDDNGNILSFYHGTDANFDKFEKSIKNWGFTTRNKKSFYFTTNKEYVNSRMNNAKYIKNVYLNLKTPAIINPDRSITIGDYNYSLDDIRETLGLRKNAVITNDRIDMFIDSKINFVPRYAEHFNVSIDEFVNNIETYRKNFRGSDIDKKLILNDDILSLWKCDGIIDKGVNSYGGIQDFAIVFDGDSIITNETETRFSLDLEGREVNFKNHLFEVYHGSTKLFNTFDTSHKNRWFKDSNVNFFTDNQNVSDSYGNEQYKSFVKFSNPYILEGETDGYSLEYSKTGKAELAENKEIISTIQKKLDSNGSKYWKKSFNTVLEIILNNKANVLSGEEIDYLINHPFSLAYLSFKAKEGFLPYSNGLFTNDIVNAVLAINEKIDSKYDGVVFDSIQDSGRYYSNESFEKSNVFVTFDNSNIISTDSKDIRFSLDSEGRELSEGQAEHFKDSKARDEQGRLLQLYHGSPTKGITVFDINKVGTNTRTFEKGIFFTDNKEFADEFSFERKPTSSRFIQTKGEKGQVYTAYLNIVKPFDLRNLSKNDIKVLKEMYKDNVGREITDKEIASLSLPGEQQLIKSVALDFERLKELGYDGLIAKTDDSSTEYVVFESNQIKNVDNLNPTEDPDIRFSLDSEGREISAGQQEFFKDSKARDDEGRLQVLYHGTNNFGFNEVRESVNYFYLTDNFEAADTYSGREKTSRRYNSYGNPGVYEFYANIKNPYILDCKGQNWDNLEFNGEKGLATEDVAVQIRRSTDCDGIIFKNIVDLDDRTKSIVSNVYVVFDSNQVKNVDNLNPTYSSDFRYSIDNNQNSSDYSIDFYRNQAIKNIDDVETQQLMNDLFDELKEYRELVNSGQLVDRKLSKLWTDIEKDQVKQEERIKRQEVIDKYKEKLENTKKELVETKQKGKEEIARIKKTNAVAKRWTDAEVKEQIAKVKEEKEKSIAELKQKAKDSKAKAKERRTVVELKHDITKQAKELGSMLKNPTDKKHVPENFRKELAEFLTYLDFTTDKQKESTQLKLQNLIMQYRDIADRQDQDWFTITDGVMGNYQLFDDTVYSMMRELDGKRIADMDVFELSFIETILKSIKTRIYNANKLFLEGRYLDISEITSESLKGIKENSDYKGGPASPLLASVNNMARMQMLRPIDYFEAVGLNKVYNGLRKSYDDYIDKISIAKDFVENELLSNKELLKSIQDEKLYKFKLENGQEISLTKGQLLTLYNTNKREQARGHIYGFGIKPADAVVKSKEVEDGTPRWKTSYKRTVHYSPVQVTEKDVMNMINTLSEEEIALADNIMDFFEVYAKSWINTTTLRMYGYEKATAENYFPIFTDSNFLDTNFDVFRVDPTINNWGSLKNTIQGAKNAIIIKDILDIFTEHISKSAMYSAFAESVDATKRVINYKNPTDGSIKDLMDTKFGHVAFDYLKNFMFDVQAGMRTDKSPGWWTTLMKNYKSAVIGANIRSVAQQPTAYTKALTYMDPKYLVNGITTKSVRDEMYKYSRIARYKHWGFSNMDIGRDLRSILLDERKLTDWAFEGLQFADDFTWGKLWNAVKLEIADTRPEITDNEEFMKAVADRFDYIIDKTQVVDSVFHKADVLRQKDSAWKVATAFMSEPTAAYSMLASSVKQYNKDKTQDNLKQVYRTFSTVGLTMINTATVCTLVDLFWRKIDLVPDDDKDKWYMTWLNNILDQITGLLPGVKELGQILLGYEPTRMEWQGVIKAWNAISALGDYVSSVASGDDSVRKNTLPVLIKNVVASIADLNGIPANDLLRELDSAANATLKVTNDYKTYYAYTKTQLSPEYSTNKSKYMDILWEAYKRYKETGDKSDFEFIKDDLENEHGYSEKYIQDSLKKRDIKEVQSNKELESAYRDYLKSGDDSKLTKEIDSLLEEEKSNNVIKKALENLKKEALGEDTEKAVKYPTPEKVAKALKAGDKDLANRIANALIDKDWTKEEVMNAVDKLMD